jgi:hypothetical protein
VARLRPRDPDGDRVRQCLVDNQPNLSTPCWNVIERYRLAQRADERTRAALDHGAGRADRWTARGTQ